MTGLVLPELPAPSVLRWAEATPEAPAILQAGSVRRYRELAGDVARWAAVLRSRGLGPGRLVAIQGDDRAAHLTVTLACNVVGAPYVSISESDLRADHALRHACAAIIAEMSLRDLPCGEALALDLAALRHEAESMPEDLATLATVWPDDVILRLSRTSGTTGQPKLVAHNGPTWRGNLATQLFGRSLSGIGGGYLNFYGLNVGSTQLNAACALALGETIRFTDPAGFIRDFNTLPEFSASMVSSEAAILAAHGQAAGWTARRCAIHVIGATLPDAVRAGLAAHVATIVQNTYSSVEAGRLAHLAADGIADVIPFVDIRILDEDGQPLPQGETGRISVRSPGMFVGYFGDARGGLAVTDGWLAMPDLGMIPSPGRLRVLGRADDMLNIAGSKVAPDPLEARLRALPGVADAALLGVPDTQGIDRLLVLLDLRGAPAAPDLMQRVLSVLPANLGEVSLAVVDTLPRTESGKLRRARLRAAWQARAAATAPG